MGSKPRRSSYQTHCIWETLMSDADPEGVEGVSREMATGVHQGHRDLKDQPEVLAGAGGHLQTSRLPGRGVSCPLIRCFPPTSLNLNPVLYLQLV